MVELVRDLRSSKGYIDGDFRTFAIDVGSLEFDSFLNLNNTYDYVFNLSALKHVRSEKDSFTLMRMISVNILNSISIANKLDKLNTKKYFCVSTDKSSNPVNMMGASKRIMEISLFDSNFNLDVSTARFANVAFSDGSLLDGFNYRMSKKQPFSVPKDIKRYFLTKKESGILCLLSGLVGDDKQIFFPNAPDEIKLISFKDIAKKFIEMKGFEPFICNSEEEARNLSKTIISKKQWPCYFFDTKTTGEKEEEEFFSESEEYDLNTYQSIGVINYKKTKERKEILELIDSIESFKNKKEWTKKDLIKLFGDFLNNFNHLEKNKFLDDQM